MTRPAVSRFPPTLDRVVSTETEPPDEPPHRKSLFSYPPFRWLRQEDFYRDLTANTLAAGIVAIIGYLYAIGAGYIHSPTGAQAARGVTNILINLSFFASVIFGMFFAPFRTPTRYANTPRWRLLTWRVLWIANMIWIALLTFHFMGGALNNVWPFDQPGWESPVAPQK
jgi:hypothetical protein